MITIAVRHGDFQKAMRRFKDAMWRTRTIEQHLRSTVFEKPSARRSRKHRKAVYRQCVQSRLINN